MTNIYSKFNFVKFIIMFYCSFLTMFCHFYKKHISPYDNDDYVLLSDLMCLYHSGYNLFLLGRFLIFD
jgi:hypothetical protein